MQLDRSIDGDDDIGLIKIDVEGAEPIVIAGATKLLERSRPPIIFEFSQEMSARVSGGAPADLFHKLFALGYQISLIDRTTGRLIPIPDPDQLMAEWDDFFRIEDFLAQPA